MPTNPDTYEPILERLPRLQLSVEEAAATMGLPVSTLLQLQRRGDAPVFFRAGRRTFTTPALIAEWQARKIEEARAERESA